MPPTLNSAPPPPEPVASATLPVVVAPSRAIAWGWWLAALCVLAGGILQASPLNRTLFLLINQHAHDPRGWLAPVWASFSVAGYGLGALILALAVSRQQPRILAALAICLPLGGGLAQALKLAWATGRPVTVWAAGDFQLIGTVLHNPAMPSGHSLAAFALATVACAAAGSGRRVWTTGLWYGLAACVAVSRVALGQHWPSDIVVGAGLGLAVARLALWVGGHVPEPTAPIAARWQRGLALLELVLAVAVLCWPSGFGPGLPMPAVLALVAVYSALARWRHARPDAGMDTATPRLVLPCVAAGLLLAVLLREQAWAPLRLALQQVSPLAWSVVALGLWGSYALRAERLRREWGTWARAQQPPARPLSFHESLDLFLAHNAALVLLPMRAGEAGYPWLLKRRFGIPVADSVRSLLWLRLQDTAVLAWLGLVLLAPWAWGVRLGLGAAALVAAFGLLPPLMRRLGQASPKLAALQASLLEHRADRLGWGLCAANWGLKLSLLGGLLALLAGLDATQGLGGAVAGELAAALPLQAPAGLGTYEAAIWAAGQWLGAQVPMPQMAAAALAVHAASLASAVLSFALYRGASLARMALGLGPQAEPSSRP